MHVIKTVLLFSQPFFLLKTKSETIIVQNHLKHILDHLTNDSNIVEQKEVHFTGGRDNMVIPTGKQTTNLQTFSITEKIYILPSEYFSC